MDRARREGPGVGLLLGASRPGSRTSASVSVPIAAIVSASACHAAHGTGHAERAQQAEHDGSRPRSRAARPPAAPRRTSAHSTEAGRSSRWGCACPIGLHPVREHLQRHPQPAEDRHRHHGDDAAGHRGAALEHHARARGRRGWWAAVPATAPRGSARNAPVGLASTPVSQARSSPTASSAGMITALAAITEPARNERGDRPGHDQLAQEAVALVLLDLGAGGDGGAETAVGGHVDHDHAAGLPVGLVAEHHREQQVHPHRHARSVKTMNDARW